MVKRIAKEYEDSKQACVFIPRKRPTLLNGVKVTTEGYTETGRIGYNRETVERIHPEDRKVIKNYEQRMYDVWLLEHGVAAIPDDRTRAIAMDTLLKGMRTEDMGDKYGISRRTAFRELERAIRYVADFIERDERNL